MLTSAPPLVQHAPWEGSEFLRSGLNGQKIAIVGYSHWGAECDEDDYPEYTNEVDTGVVSGAIRSNFFTCIRNYFGYESHAEFWSKVVFFNYLPRCIGGPDARFAEGTPEEHEEGGRRFFSIVGDLK